MVHRTALHKEEMSRYKKTNKQKKAKRAPLRKFQEQELESQKGSCPHASCATSFVTLGEPVSTMDIGATVYLAGQL